MDSSDSTLRCICDGVRRTRANIKALGNVCDLCGGLIVVEESMSRTRAIRPISPGVRSELDYENISGVGDDGSSNDIDHSGICRCVGMKTQQFVNDTGNKCPHCNLPIRVIHSTFRSMEGLEERNVQFSEGGEGSASRSSFWSDKNEGDRKRNDGKLEGREHVTKTCDDDRRPSKENSGNRLDEWSFGPVPKWVNNPRLDLPLFDGSKGVNVRHFFL